MDIPIDDDLIWIEVHKSVQSSLWYAMDAATWLEDYCPFGDIFDCAFYGAISDIANNK